MRVCRRMIISPNPSLEKRGNGKKEIYKDEVKI